MVVVPRISKTSTSPCACTQLSPGEELSYEVFPVLGIPNNLICFPFLQIPLLLFKNCPRTLVERASLSKLHSSDASPMLPNCR